MQLLQYNSADSQMIQVVKSSTWNSENAKMYLSTRMHLLHDDNFNFKPSEKKLLYLSSIFDLQDVLLLRTLAVLLNFIQGKVIFFLYYLYEFQRLALVLSLRRRKSAYSGHRTGKLTNFLLSCCVTCIFRSN